MSADGAGSGCFGRGMTEFDDRISMQSRGDRWLPSCGPIAADPPPKPRAWGLIFSCRPMGRKGVALDGE